MSGSNEKVRSPLVVTNPYELIGELDRINILFEKGLEILHIRKPGYSREQMEEMIKQVRPEYRNRIMLHKHYSLVAKYGLRGIHLNVKQRKSWLYKYIIVPLMKHQYKSLKLSAAVYRINTLKEVSGNFDYLLFGPVFKGIGSRNKQLKYDSAEMKKAIQGNELPVVALGGVTESDLDDLHMLGFENAAVQSYLWKNVEPVKAFESLLKANSKASIKLRVAS